MLRACVRQPRRGAASALVPLAYFLYWLLMVFTRVHLILNVLELALGTKKFEAQSPKVSLILVQLPIDYIHYNAGTTASHFLLN